MAIEVISTIIPKNNGNFPIVLSNDVQGGIHYTETVNEMNNIVDEKKQIGMLCYVSSKKVYYVYIGNNNWKPFTASPDFSTNLENHEALKEITIKDLENWNNKVDKEELDDEVNDIKKLIDEKVDKEELDDTYHRVFRVDNDIEVEQILGKYGNAVGTGSMAFVKNTRNTYIFLGDEWANINTFGTNIHVGSVPPEDKTMVWIDISDDEINEDIINDETNNGMLKAILESIESLRKDVDNIKAIIKNGNITWPDDEDKPTVENVIKLILENGDFFITEDGDYIVDEVIEYIEPSVPKKDVILLENGDFFVTENGDYIINEISSGNDNENSESSQNTTNKVIGETGDVLITEFGEYIIQEI